MSKADKWNQFFDRPGYVYGKEPLLLLKNEIHRLHKGKALDLAMGEGRNAVFLAQHGFDVIGFDISKTAVDKATKLAYDQNVKIETKITDLDLYIFPVMGFDTIIVSYFKPVPRYYNEIVRALSHGGTVLIENYTTDQLMRAPLAEFRNEDYFYPNELLKNLKNLQILFYNEDEVDGKYIVQCIAKKPSDKDAVKYGFAKADPKANESRFKAAEDLFKKK